ncbi:sugar O-acyltransferase (sialic acid O-acetyltransferase NeuD family) [Angulomicrobium tetraedrale]|uniref:Sugar O-acyltransferase (Sialic acid O-acetyltransferase NeuD family) n=1 Tax=Ancylobacter tetraedralis TaxID=217068 RepID=A0A839ZAF2_9HYPH|nr:acetyltransferase [Ancylobacter tetraedralis]MBB3771678.1 sugar O-acyltransferase (sialic acid O-acetyltransferase NeuD family) [Ancylobacter tetraedralis]
MANVIIFGVSNISALNYAYLTNDSPHQVAGFAVDRAFIRQTHFCDLPVVAFEDLENRFPPTEYAVSVLLGYRGINEFREAKYREAKSKGYQLVSYLSSKATVWPGVEIGENTCICEGAVIQPYAKIGNNCVIGPTCFVGHHSVIGDHCFISAGAKILGDVKVGDWCVIGANATITDGVTIGQRCILGARSLITNNASERGVYIEAPTKRLAKSSDELGRLLTWSEDTKTAQIPSRD